MGLDGLRVTIVGDVLHSRVARSNVLLLSTLGAEVTVVAPPTLMPYAVESWPCKVSYDLDAELRKADVVMMLRVQQERMSAAYFPSVREYRRRYGLDAGRMALLPEHAIVDAPGPDEPRRGDRRRGRGLAAVDDRGPGEQRGHVRMAVLYLLLGGAAARERRHDRGMADQGRLDRGRPGRRGHPPRRRRDRRRRRGHRRADGARPRRPGADRAARPRGPAHAPARAGQGGRRDGGDRHQGRRARRLHRGARDGEHRAGRRHRRGRRAGLAARPAGRVRRRPPGRRGHRGPGTAGSSRSSARWPTRPRRSGCSPTTATASPTRC